MCPSLWPCQWTLLIAVYWPSRFGSVATARAPPRTHPGLLDFLPFGHFLWVLVWAGACYRDGVGGFVFNSTSSGPPMFFFFTTKDTKDIGVRVYCGWQCAVYSRHTAGPKSIAAPKRPGSDTAAVESSLKSRSGEGDPRNEPPKHSKPTPAHAPHHAPCSFRPHQPLASAPHVARRSSETARAHRGGRARAPRRVAAV